MQHYSDVRGATQMITSRTHSSPQLTSKSPILSRVTVTSLFAAIFILLLAVASFAQDSGGVAVISHDDVETCMGCHSEDIGATHKVTQADLQKSPHKDLKCQDCHTSINAAPHSSEMLKEKPSCGTCHSDVQEPFSRSAHSNRDKVPGDHPTCVSCHGMGNPHAVKRPTAWTSRYKLVMCSHCHEDAVRMKRYGADPDAVPSYKESFHGKALLRFGNGQVAMCTDCHGVHGVLSPHNPAAPTHRNNATRTCSQAGCHAGAKLNFAMSGANHLRLKTKATPLLLGEIWVFRILIVSIISGMMFFIALDLRKQVFGTQAATEEGRLVGSLMSFSFFCMALSLALAALEVRAALWFWIVAVASLLLGLLAYLLQRKPHHAQHDERLYQRWSPALRAQHILLMLSFTVLAFTGLPLRFANVPGVPDVLFVVGGLSKARLLHRGAGILLICVFVWHIGWLLYRWHRAGYSLRSWTMLPTRKDVADVVGTARYYFGLQPQEPRFDRFQFRTKADYWAEWWGIPVMSITGMILWFPIDFSNRLPEAAISFALIAHSYEATLAFLAIVTWHLYNVHFNPRTFPMNHVWYRGSLTRTEMEHEHPLELERIEKQEQES